MRDGAGLWGGMAAKRRKRHKRGAACGDVACGEGCRAAGGGRLEGTLALHKMIVGCVPMCARCATGSGGKAALLMGHRTLNIEHRMKMNVEGGLVRVKA